MLPRSGSVQHPNSTTSIFTKVTQMRLPTHKYYRQGKIVQKMAVNFLLLGLIPTLPCYPENRAYRQAPQLAWAQEPGANLSPSLILDANLWV